MPEVKTILIVCTGNSCRSVMAAGLLKKFLKGDYKIITAGVAAVDGMRATSAAIQVMSCSRAPIKRFMKLKPRAVIE